MNKLKSDSKEISTPTPTRFSSPFTVREEELQKLLAQERLRSEQRRNNYQTLKDEHLKLQNEFLALQNEMKQILEETMYFKEKKNTEIDQLLKENEEKVKQIVKLEKCLRDADPEVIKLKCIDELNEPIRRLQQEKDRLEKQRDKVVNELKLSKQQLEHFEKEHLDSIEKIKLSYEAEINLIKCEKEEIRNRLVEASQSPDVKRLLELSEENSRLARKLQSTQSTIEQAELQYRHIQKRIEDFVIEQEEKEKSNEAKLKTLNDHSETYKQEVKKLKSEIFNLKSENEEALIEIGRLRRVQDKLKSDSSQQLNRLTGEKEELRVKMGQEIKLLIQEKTFLNEEIKKLKAAIEKKDESIESLEKMVSSKSKELTDQINLVREEDFEKILKLEQEKKILDNEVKDSDEERQVLKSEIERLRKQIEQCNEKRLSEERETMLLRTKLDSQAISIEELEKIRRQHMALHEETNRLRAETFDLTSTNKDLVRINQNSKEECARLKDLLEEERRNVEEMKITNEKTMSKMMRRCDEEREELRDKIHVLERENSRLKSGGKVDHRSEEYTRLKAKQYTKIANRLNTFLEQLKSDPQTAEPKEIKSKNYTADLPENNDTVLVPMEAHNHLKRELQKIKAKQIELEACINASKSSLQPSTSSIK